MGFLTYRILSGIYYAITGKTRPPKEEKKAKEQVVEPTAPEVVIRTKTPASKVISEYIPKANYFCSECGIKFSDKMMYQIESKGVAFCEHCGKGFTLTQPIYETHVIRS